MTADAIVEMVQLWTPLARKLAMQRGASRHDTDDLIQAAAEKLLRHHAEGRRPRNPVAYFLRAVIHGAYNWHRDHRLELTSEEVTL